MEAEQGRESNTRGEAKRPGSASRGLAMKLVDARTRVVVRNILMAVDFSPSSNGALAYATAMAHRYGSRIYLAHVIRPDVYQLVSPEAMETVLEQTRHYAEQQMAKILISGRLRGIPHQVLLGQGELWTIFSKLIDEHEVDLVVMGTHGRTGLEKMLIGSVAERIFRLASCPVMTVGPRAPGEAPEDARLQRVLYATDFSAEAGCAAAYALSLAQEQQATLMLLHVSDRARADATVDTAAVIERLKALVPPEADPWCNPRYEVKFGSPADGILKAANEYKADLIVMGVRHPDFSFSHLPPATAYKVVCRAPCPVLTVRG